MFLNKESGGGLFWGEVTPPLVEKGVAKVTRERESCQEFIVNESSEVIGSETEYIRKE